MGSEFKNNPPPPTINNKAALHISTADSLKLAILARHYSMLAGSPNFNRVTKEEQDNDSLIHMDGECSV